MFVLLSPGGRRSQPFQSLQCPRSVPDFFCVDHVFPRKCMEKDCWSNKQKTNLLGCWKTEVMVNDLFVFRQIKVRRFGTQLLRFTGIYCSYGSRRSFRYRSKPSGGWHHWSHESLWHLGRSAREITAKGNLGCWWVGSMPLVSTPPWYWWLVGGLEHEFGLFFHFIYGIILPID